MKSIVHPFVAVALAATLAAGAIAQTPPPAGTASAPAAGALHGKRMDPAQRQARYEQRMAALKQKLQITPDQEAAWTSFTTAMRPAANPQRPDREALARMSTPDRIDQMRALRNQHIAEMDRRGDAVKAFYATLSPAQQKLFDESAMRGRRMGHHGGHGEHGQGGMPRS